MPCGKEGLVKITTPTSQRYIERLTKKVLNGELFGFVQVDIEVPEELYDKFSEMAPLFVVDEITPDQVPEHMEQYRKATGRKENKNSRKLLGVMKAKKILLYTPLLKWYIEHGLKVTAYHQLLLYKPGRPFDWFPQEVANARRQADKHKDHKIAGETSKLKGNSFLRENDRRCRAALLYNIYNRRKQSRHDAEIAVFCRSRGNWRRLTKFKKENER